MINPNFIFVRTIHDHRIDDALRHQSHGVAPANHWRRQSRFQLDTAFTFAEKEAFMIPDPMESAGRAHWQALLEAAEQHRLVKRATAQSATEVTTIGQFRCWLGAQFVKWGLHLQGYRGTALPQLPACAPCNGS